MKSKLEWKYKICVHSMTLSDRTKFLFDTFCNVCNKPLALACPQCSSIPADSPFVHTHVEKLLCTLLMLKRRKNTLFSMLDTAVIACIFEFTIGYIVIPFPLLTFVPRCALATYHNTHMFHQHCCKSTIKCPHDSHHPPSIHTRIIQECGREVFRGKLIYVK